MKQKRLLYALGWVKDEYIEEMLDPTMERVVRRAPRKKLWLIAAVIAALLLTGCAAVILMRLENLTISQGVLPDEEMAPTEVYTQISLQGFAGTPNYEAAKEWDEFLSQYDQDNNISQSLSTEEMDMGEEYFSYICYTREMADKIDEICEKYGLQKRGRYQMEQPWENIARVLQVEDIVHSSSEMNVTWDVGYIFRSGSFMMEGDVDFQDCERVGFQFNCSAKTDFDGVALNIGNIEDYQQWTSVSADGGEVLLAVSPEKALIFADREDFFVSLNFMIYDRQISREELQDIAKMFDFSFRLHPVSDEDWEYLDSHKKEYPEPAPLGTFLGISYDEQIRGYFESEFVRAEELDYALMDVDGIEGDELLIGKDGFVGVILATDGENTYETPVGYHMFDVKESVLGYDGITYVPSYGQICEGKKILYVFEKKDETTFYQIADSANGRLDWTTMLKEDPGQNTYYKWVGQGREVSWAKQEEITKAEFDEILSTCVPIDVPMTPLTEYPLK